MRPHLTLGRIFGITIGLHASWFFIAFLITLAAGQRWWLIHPEWGSGVIWATALSTAGLFFAGLLVHELSHALVAQARGLPVESITLFALGGVAHIKKEAGDPQTEFWMGLVGPITSLAIGAGCLALAGAIGPAPTPPYEVLVWLGYINIVLAIFNLVPGFPLDGGRILRAILWGVTRDADRATRIAARTGQIVALSFIVLGILNAFTGVGFGGLWLALIGWFLYEAARASEAQVAIAASLRNVRVRDVMTRECEAVDRRSTVQRFVDDQLLRTGRRCFVVKENGAVAGLVTAKDVTTVDRGRWPETPVEAVMRPLDRLRTVEPEAPITAALETMQQEDLNQLLVMDHDRFVGVVARHHVVQLLEARAALSM